MQIKATGAIMNNTNGAAPAEQSQQPRTANRDLFECPVCLDFAFPPIPQCPNGHIVCTPCRQNVGSCPTCRVAMGDIRNLTLEKLAEDVDFPCKFSINGCDVQVHYRAKKQHEAGCDFRLFNCPSPDPFCKWMGCVSSIFEHLTSHELVTAITGKRVKFLATEINRGGSVHWVMVQSCFDHHFLTILEKETIENEHKFSAFIKMMGTKEDAKKFTGRLELKGEKGRLMWMGTPYSINDTSAGMKNDCLVFNGEVAQRAIENESLCLMVQIFCKKN